MLSYINNLTKIINNFHTIVNLFGNYSKNDIAHPNIHQPTCASRQRETKFLAKRFVFPFGKGNLVRQPNTSHSKRFSA